MQVALYARVSTSQQEKTDTIESQLEALHAYVAAHDHTVLPEHIFLDNGVSGSRLDRPALDRLRDQARFGDFDAVIILSPDRLARSYPHQWLLLEEFKKEGCQVIFMENPFGDSPHGQLLAQMQGMIAEYERSQIADRTRRGRLHKARKTEFLPWAYRVYGYHYIPKQAGLLPRVEIHPEQAAVVRDMFRWLIQEQLTTRQIVKRLNALRVPTRTGQNPVWHAASVRGILNNSIYTGQGYYNRTKSGVPRKESRRKFHPRTDNYAREPRPPEEWVPITAPAILSTETFAKAQEQLKQNQAKARRAYQPRSQRYLLRTLVRCGQCQLHMQAGHQLSVCKRYEYLYYCCAGKDPVTVGRVERCPSRRVRADRLDTLVWSLVRELLQDPQVILQEYALWQHVQQGQQGQFQEQLDRIDTQRQHLERQLQRLIDAYQQEIITLHDLSTRREQITQRLKGFEQERHHVEQQRDTTIKWDRIADNIEQFRTLLGSNLDLLSYEDRQAVVQLLVEKVVVYQDGAVEVHHVLPFEEQPAAVDQKKKGIPGEFYVLRLQHLHRPPIAIRYGQQLGIQVQPIRDQDHDVWRPILPRLARGDLHQAERLRQQARMVRRAQAAEDRITHDTRVHGGGREGALLLDLVSGVVLHPTEEAARQVVQFLKQVIVDIAPIDDVEAARLHQAPPLGPLRPVPGRDRHIDGALPQDRKRDMHLRGPMLVILPQGPGHARQGGQEAAIDGNQLGQRGLFGPWQWRAQVRTQGDQHLVQQRRVKEVGRFTQATQGRGVDAEALLHFGEGCRLLQTTQAGDDRVKEVEQQ
jgi:site-specific DNA recombinase